MTHFVDVNDDGLPPACLVNLYKTPLFPTTCGGLDGQARVHLGPFWLLMAFTFCCALSQLLCVRLGSLHVYDSTLRIYASSEMGEVVERGTVELFVAIQGPIQEIKRKGTTSTVLALS